MLTYADVWTKTQERTQNPAFNQTFTVPVVNRQSDVVVVTLMQLGSSGVADVKKDLVIGKAQVRIGTGSREPAKLLLTKPLYSKTKPLCDGVLSPGAQVKIADFGKNAKDKTWSGTVSGWMDLVNEDGTPVLGQVGVSSSSAKAAVDLRLQFVEAPKKRVQVLGLLALLVQKYKYCGCSLCRRFRSASRYIVYLLYWYKSINTDAAARAGAGDGGREPPPALRHD